MNAFTKKFRSIKKFPDWIYFLPALLLKVLFRLFYRLEVVIPEGYTLAKYRGTIGAAWHNRILFFPLSFPDEVRRHTSAMISASRDGQYLVDLLKQFHVGSIRGSSSRGGVNAQLAAFRELEAGRNVIYTPDGPRGPRYTIKPGLIQLASRTGAPLAVIALNASRYWELHSWDGLQIPKPFAKITLTISELFHVPPDLNDEEREAYRVKFQQLMRDYTVDRKPPVF